MQNNHEADKVCVFNEITGEFETVDISPRRPILYTQGCPLCRGLEQLLKACKVEYDVCTDYETMKSKGIRALPYLELEDGTLMDYRHARDWLMKRKGK